MIQLAQRLNKSRTPSDMEINIPRIGEQLLYPGAEVMILFINNDVMQFIFKTMYYYGTEHTMSWQ